MCAICQLKVQLILLRASSCTPLRRHAHTVKMVLLIVALEPASSSIANRSFGFVLSKSNAGSQRRDTLWTNRRYGAKLAVGEVNVLSMKANVWRSVWKMILR